MADNAHIAEITDQTFEAEILQSDRPVLIDFWAEWCGPCRQIAPIISELAEEYGDRVKVAKMNVDDSPQTPGRYGVRAIPTVLAFRNGQVVAQVNGFRPKADFKEMIEKLL
jgi:thioredoxin 1